MYLFSRTARVGPATGVPWAVEITELVRRRTGQDLRLWSTAYSSGVGTMTWTGWFEDLVHLEFFSNKIGDMMHTDEAYMALLEQGSALIEGSVDDSLMQLLTDRPDPEREVTYASAVGAVCAAGHARRGLMIGMQIAEHAERTSGTPTMFLRSVTGSYGGVGWITTFEDIEQMEQGEAKLAADDSWIDLIDSAEGAFVEDVKATSQTIYRRIG
mgnify:CR=1 FL=1